VCVLRGGEFVGQEGGWDCLPESCPKSHPDFNWCIWPIRTSCPNALQKPTHKAPSKSHSPPTS